MVKRHVFDEVGGLEEEFKVDYNDIDFCLKICSRGYRIVYRPEAVLYHYESVSRGKHDTYEKKKRFFYESTMLQLRWPDYHLSGDPFLNINMGAKPYYTLDKDC